MAKSKAMELDLESEIEKTKKDGTIFCITLNVYTTGANTGTMQVWRPFYFMNIFLYK